MEYNKALVLADVIWSFHFIIVLFIIIAPFTNIPSLLFLHITFSICLIVHWYSNSNICSLSLFESKLRGLHYTKTFMHSFVSPIYDQTYYIITVLLMCKSIYSIYKNKEMIKKTFKNIYKSNSLEELHHNLIPLILR